MSFFSRIAAMFQESAPAPAPLPPVLAPVAAPAAPAPIAVAPAPVAAAVAPPAPAPLPIINSRDPAYMYPANYHNDGRPADPGYPTGGYAASQGLPVLISGAVTGSGVAATPKVFAPGELDAARAYRVAMSVWGANDSRTIAKADALTAYADWGSAYQYAGAEGYDGAAEAALYTQFGGK